MSKVALPPLGKGWHFQEKVSEQLIVDLEKIKLVSYLIPCTKVNSRCIKGTKFIKKQNLKKLEGNIGEYLYDLEVGKGLFFFFKEETRGFPGGAVVKNLPANAGDTGSSPGLGRSHMPRSN